MLTPPASPGSRDPVNYHPWLTIHEGLTTVPTEGKAVADRGVERDHGTLHEHKVGYGIAGILSEAGVAVCACQPLAWYVGGAMDNQAGLISVDLHWIDERLLALLAQKGNMTSMIDFLNRLPHLTLT